MKLSKIMGSTLFAIVLLTSPTVFAGYSFNTTHYDHATVGEHFYPGDMVTQCIEVGPIKYYPKFTNYKYLYADGTTCLVQVDPGGNVHNILVERP